MDSDHGLINDNCCLNKLLYNSDVVTFVSQNCILIIDKILEMENVFLNMR